MRCTSLLLISALAFPATACDSAVERSVVVNPVSPLLSGHPNGNWSDAVSVDPQGIHSINTPALEGCPNESPNGRTLYFATDREGQIDIWFSRRNGNGDWGSPEKLPPPVNSTANDFCPTALPDGGLMFVSNRADGHNCGVGTADIYETRPDRAGGWVQPQHLGCQVNSAGNEFSPSFVAAGGDMLFFSSDRAGSHAIYMSLREPGGAWGTPAPVAELGIVGFQSLRPTVSQDGREIVFDSDRPGGEGAFDIWYAHRATPWDSWSAPVNAGPAVNSASSETRASLSRDGRRLYFGSNRPGFMGNSDLFESER